jgi:surface antigen
MALGTTKATPQGVRRQRVVRSITGATVAALMLTLLGALAPSASAAVYTYLCQGFDSCANQGRSHYGFKTGRTTAYWRMAAGSHCTNYVAFRYVTRKYDKLANTRPWTSDGNARNWGPANPSKTNSTPKVGSTAWWAATSASPFGHVAYVERVVSSSEIWVSESNTPGVGGPEFAWRKVTKSSGGWPNGFVHFRDEDLNPTTSPSVSGTPKVGVTLTANKGTWKSSSGITPSATVTYKYQWLANGSVITGQTNATYTPTAAVAGQRISVKVTTAAPGYIGASATSGQTAAVAKGTISNTATPVITGTPKVDNVMKVSTGAWSPGATSYAYQWHADGLAITGATGSTFTPKGGQAGKRLTATVTAKLTGYNDAAKTSAASAAVAPGALTSTGAPQVTGPAEVDKTLLASSGSWTPVPDATSYTWLADGVEIPGATGDSLTLTTDQVGAIITVRQSATKAGYSPSSQTSAATGPVIGGDPIEAGNPSISGTATYGSTLTAGAGAWGPAPIDLAYQWLRDGTPIPGATSTTYDLGESDIGTTIAVTVTGSKPGHVTTTRTSDPTEPVAALDFEASPAPVIAGAATLDETLTAEVPVWTPQADSLDYQWNRDGQPIDGATETSYLLRPADVGSTITVTVEGRRSGYTPQARASEGVGPVTAQAIEASTPAITGSAVFASVLTAEPGAWGPEGVALSYQWKRNGADIAGQRSPTYTLTAADVGATVTVTVSGTLTGHLPESRTSAPTTTVAPKTMAAPTPTITGTAKQGSKLTASTSGWTAGSTFTYQWLRNGTAISGATAATYTLGEKDIGRKVSVTVTGKQAGYTTATKTSASTAVVTSLLGDRLTAGKRLNHGQAIYAPNGSYRATQQSDGNLVVSNLTGSSPRAIWSSKATGKGVAYVEMQSDGNLVQYTSARKPIWATGTNGKGGTYLRMQNDGNLVIYTSAGKAVWATGTNGK